MICPRSDAVLTLKSSDSKLHSHSNFRLFLLDKTLLHSIWTVGTEMSVKHSMSKCNDVQSESLSFLFLLSLCLSLTEKMPADGSLPSPQIRERNKTALYGKQAI